MNGEQMSFPGLFSRPGIDRGDRGNTPIASPSVTGVQDAPFPGHHHPLKGVVRCLTGENGEAHPEHPRSLPTGTGRDRGLPRPLSGLAHSATDELAEARKALAFFASEFERLQRLLAPSDATAESIKARIVASHADGKARGLNLAPDRIALRRSLFAQLADLSLEWGKPRKERKEARAQMKRLERLIEVLARAAERDARKRRPHHA